MVIFPGAALRAILLPKTLSPQNDTPVALVSLIFSAGKPSLPLHVTVYHEFVPVIAAFSATKPPLGKAPHACVSADPETVTSTLTDKPARAAGVSGAST